MGDIVYRGPGGPPPPSKSSSGGGASTGTFEQNPFHFYETLGEFQKRIKTFYIYYGERKNVVFLDKGHLDWTIFIHARFYYDSGDGKPFDNYAVCRKKVDSKGCPLCDQLGDPTWFTVGSLIDRSEFTPKEGKNAGVTYRDFRRLLLIPRSRLEVYTEMAFDKDDGINGDWRGKIFKVKRSSRESNPKTPRIGNDWRPLSRLSEEELFAAFEDLANEKEIPPEDYIAPIDYDNLLSPFEYDAMLELAEELKGHVAPPSKWDKPKAQKRYSRAKSKDRDDTAAPF